MALAFVDDSAYGGDSQYYVLAGYSASEEVWKAFSRDWQSALDTAPRLDYFKMYEAEGRTGQFAGFTRESRDYRLGQFIDVILTHELLEASVAIRDRDFSDVLYPVLPTALASPYYCAFIAMVTAFSGIYRHSGFNETVHFIFDEQDGMQNRMMRLYAQFRGWYPHWNLGGVTYQNDKERLPLQASDLIAWQTRRFMCSSEGTRADFRRLHSVRTPFRSVLKRRDVEDFAFAIKENLPLLRSQVGNEILDSLLTGIEKRNRRQGIGVK